MTQEETSRIEEKQPARPVAWLHNEHPDAYVITQRVKDIWLNVKAGHVEHYTIPLYLDLRYGVAKQASSDDIEGAIKSGALTAFPSPESPAKEQPGEQNAAPQAGQEAKPAPSNEGHASGLAVAALVEELKAIANTSELSYSQCRACEEAAALIEKLGSKAQVMHDLHAALGVKWGEDPYTEINRLKHIERLYAYPPPERP